jgi:hypothetical protein
VEEEEAEDEGACQPEFNQPWKAPFLVFACKGRVEIYRNYLEQRHYPIDPQTLKLIEIANQGLEAWLSQSWNQVVDLFEKALPTLLKQFHACYLPHTNADVGWSFDEFLEERDLVEFFLVGVGDLVPLGHFRQKLIRGDTLIRNRIHTLGLEEFSECFFTDRISWYPERFWWHHPRR